MKGDVSSVFIHVNAGGGTSSDNALYPPQRVEI